MAGETILVVGAGVGVGRAQWCNPDWRRHFPNWHHRY